MFNRYVRRDGLSGVIFSLAVCTLWLAPLSAEAEGYYTGSATRVRVHHSASYWQRHPKVKSAAIGGGVGAASGALVGGLTHHGVMRGAAIGAGTGAGVGLIRSSQTMKRHPIVKDVATGSAVGLGLGWAGGRGGSRAFKGAAIGGAVGLGAGLLRHKF